MTAAMAQVALTGGAPISYFGILSLVYYDAESGEVHTMNAEWNTVRGESEPMSIPGGIAFGSDDALRGTGAPSGRTAMVGGFMKGVEAAHQRFGKLPFAQLFEPSIYIAEQGIPVTEKFEGYLDFRGEDLFRLPETRKIFTREDGTLLRTGDTFKQPGLAETLRQVSQNGADYMYGGPWGKRLIEALDRDGGKMTLEDLEAYEVQWSQPLRARIGDPADGWEIFTNPPPNQGGVGLIEAQNLARASGLLEDGHWSESPDAFRKALTTSQMVFLNFLPREMLASFYPDLDFSPEARVTPEHAQKLWQAMQAGKSPFQWSQSMKQAALIEAAKPRHSDDVVVIDKDGNIAALTQSINCVLWGKTAIVVDGITIGDPASFQQIQIARTEPGGRLESPTETGILFQHGKPVLGFASMGSGLHQRTLQGLLNFTEFGMGVREAIDAPDFFMPKTDPKTFKLSAVVPSGRFPRRVLDGSGLAVEELNTDEARFGGEGIWVAISRDPATGKLKAASHNRNNSAAVAF
jgi:gamma-glutamyltranspeptidase/glutathione hydrolase